VRTVNDEARLPAGMPAGRASAAGLTIKWPKDAESVRQVHPHGNLQTDYPMHRVDLPYGSFRSNASLEALVGAIRSVDGNGRPRPATADGTEVRRLLRPFHIQDSPPELLNNRQSADSCETLARSRSRLPACGPGDTIVAHLASGRDLAENG
jgi:hypothetical protein